ncbi:hypothetical protein AZI87_04495 [Bdellovibrio bacteriovorus]|uniref:Uncharacterized protein n=1 Tax=Bdellovibrio bacteriovorus TaxID=959 RepID=A0A162GMJ9_BDEBC|nr:hypothetical protein [Bdellovibrio bacteriovorus]KYG68510.1 hypothetical protein AZI87_04495 [Bdellovibrio bacteriovorus]
MSKFEMGSDVEIKKRQNDLEKLLILVEPNKELWPWFLADEATFMDIYDGSSAEGVELLQKSFPDKKIRLEHVSWDLPRLLDFLFDKKALI